MQCITYGVCCDPILIALAFVMALCLGASPLCMSVMCVAKASGAAALSVAVNSGDDA